MLGGGCGLKKGYQVNMTSVGDSVAAGRGQGPQAGGVFVHLLFFRGHVLLRPVPTIYTAQAVSPAMELVTRCALCRAADGFIIMFFLTLEEFLVFLGLGAKKAQ